MAYRDQIRIAFDPKWRQQVNASTPRAQSDLTATLPATAISMTRDLQTQLLYDCSGQVLRREVAVSRLRRLTIEVDGPSAHIAAGFFAACAGSTVALTGTDPKTQVIQLLPKTSRRMPLFTFRVGHEDGTSHGWLLSKAAVLSVVLRAAAGQDTLWKLTANLVGSYDWAEASGTSWPTCVDENPLRLYESALTIDGVDRINTTRSISVTCDSKAPLSRTPYVAGSLDIQRIIRGFRRDYGIAAGIEGVEDATDANFVDLESNSGVGAEVADTELRIGPVGENLTVNVPRANWGLDAQGQTYDGDQDAEESVLSTLIKPLDVTGSALAPVNYEAILPAAQLPQQMLLTS